MNRRFDERIAMNADSDARRLQCEFNLSNHVVQRRTVESAHIRALNEDVTRSQAEPRCPRKLLLNMTSHEEVGLTERLLVQRHPCGSTTGPQSAPAQMVPVV